MSNYNQAKALEFFRNRVGFTTGPHELEVLINSKADPSTYQVVDVRYPSDFVTGHVPGAINLPRGKWQNAKGLDRNATLYVYCYTPTCHLAAEAAVELVSQGYRVVEVEGGWDTWVNNGYAVEKPAKLAS